MKNNFLNFALVVAIVTASVSFATTLNRAILYAPVEAATTVQGPKVFDRTEANASAQLGDPVKLLIPKLKIDADIQKVGLDAKGNMASPNNFGDTAWYKNGPRPGEKGSSVITGHVDNALGLPGVFHNLHDLEIGDLIRVRTSENRTLIFSVIGKKTYRYDAVPVNIIFNNSSGIYLNLITCTGVWLRNESGYSERLVIFAKLKTI